MDKLKLTEAGNEMGGMYLARSSREYQIFKSVENYTNCFLFQNLEPPEA